MMNRDLKELLLVSAFIVIILAGFGGPIVGLGVWLNAKSCHARWDGSGMPVSWGVLEGCMVQRKDGTWIPTTAYRELGGE